MFRYFVLGFVVSFCVNWLLRPVLAKAGWIDKPAGRKKHMRPTVISGGLGLFCALAVGLLAWQVDTSNLWLALATVTLMFAVGFIDDQFPIRARYRLIVQVTAALALVLGTGGFIHQFGLARDVDLANVGWLAIGISVFFMVGLINAINMSDGSDGVASGYGGVALLGVVVFHWLSGASPLNHSPVAFATTLLMLGGLVGYYFFNYPLIRYKPAMTFMGDGGSMLLGLVVGWVLLKAGSPSHDKPLSFWFAIWLVAMPVFDAGYTITSRLLRRQDLFMADRHHLHHLLKKLGYSRRRLALTMHSTALLLAAAGLTLWHYQVPDYIAGWLLVVAFGLYSAVVSTAWSSLDDDRAWRVFRFRVKSRV